MKKFLKIVCCCLTISQPIVAQQTRSADTAQQKLVIAGPQYQRSQWHQFLWGSNYRREWTTPVRVRVLILDTAKGGLKPYKSGGGHQTKSLHLRTADGKEYALRSVDKTLGKVLPENVQHTFVEKLVNDEVSMSDPYSAAAVPMMAERAGIYHTYPAYVYVPKQRALDTFNTVYGDNLYLFEQRLSGSWKNASNLGNFEKFYSTFEVMDRLAEKNDRTVDQRAFIRARIFDWFIGDWDRHEDQWEWGERKNGDAVIYVPVPQDRDQAFSKHNGLLLNLSMAAGGLFYMQPFDNNLKDVRTFTYEERNLDRFFTNEMTLADWQDIAKDLQQLLSDEIIEASVKQLPPEIFSISGNDIISKLKSRRGHLVEWATTYYLFLAREVQIAGTKQKEHFEIRKSGNDETTVNVYRVDDAGNKIDPFYSRSFKVSETKEVRVFGLSGEDSYSVMGEAHDGIVVRIIGGSGRDSIIVNSNAVVHVYDDNNNIIQTNSQTRLHLSADTSIHKFNYDWFHYGKKGLRPSLFYSNEDRLYVGLGYQYTHFKWRKEPFVFKQSFDVHYSFVQHAFSYNYNLRVPNAVGKADLSLKANYDAVVWTHFFGLGNETEFIPKNILHFTTRTREWFIEPQLTRTWGRHTFSVSAFYAGVKVLGDSDRFVAKTYAASNPEAFNWINYAGGNFNYIFRHLNDSIIPTSGIIFSANVHGVSNLKQSSNSFVKYSGNLEFYIPLASKFSVVVRTGAATISGTPEFYQYASIGGPTLRGYRRDRFWGKSAFYNTNELRFISNVKTSIFNGRAGLLAFFDDGRVWMPGESSNVLHTGYGGGIILSPFDVILANITYGFSKDESLLQIRIIKYF